MMRAWLRWGLRRLPDSWRRGLLLEAGSTLEPLGLGDAMRRLAQERCDALPPDEALRFLLRLDGLLYALQGRHAVRYGQGVHVKHRLQSYHDFFVARIPPGTRVLDIGCGNGAMTRALAERCGVRVVGIDIVADNIARAEANPHPLVSYRVGDVLTLDETDHFDVVTLSNVLEHLPERAAFLRGLCRRVTPSRLLLRVPLFEREWRVPLKRELGVEWRLDPTHETEYTQESFDAEMGEAGLRITHREIRWGEIWAACEPEP